MSTTAQEVFAEAVRSLAPAERLRLAALLLDDLAQSHVSVVDASDTWTPEDQADLMAYSLRHAATLYPEEQDLA
jgi:hypothetical protein